MKLPPKIKVPIMALSFDLGAVFAFLLGLLMMHSGIFFLIAVLMFLVTLILPFAAIMTGVYALCLGKENIGKAGIAISIIAMAIPVVVVIVLVILFSTGVARITWM